MVSYIKTNLLADEEIIYQGHRHLIVFLFPIIWLVVGIIFFAFIVDFRKLAFVPFLVFFVSSINALIDYFMSEIAVTNKRVLIKIGFIRRVSVEAPLQNIASIKVNQTFWGRILNYGDITLCDVGRECLPFVRITSPIKFRHYVQREIDKYFPKPQKA